MLSAVRGLNGCMMSRIGKNSRYMLVTSSKFIMEAYSFDFD